MSTRERAERLWGEWQDVRGTDEEEIAWFERIIVETRAELAAKLAAIRMRLILAAQSVGGSGGWHLMGQYLAETEAQIDDLVRLLAPASASGHTTKAKGE